ncbi:MAG TPA: zinc ribbon domain-containing protein [Tepidisphaeraceae bacterium]|nr:zinc ribbon domain-containing protein [Tepidisphaeraceae bacterium]
MPTYEYKCEACGHHFDQFQSITSSPLKKCPKCGKNKLRRLIGTGAGVIFKGSGFYTTDYRSETYKSEAKSDSAPATPASTETKSPDSKPTTPATTETPKPAAPAKPEPKPSAKSSSKKK